MAFTALKKESGEGSSLSSAVNSTEILFDLLSLSLSFSLSNMGKFCCAEQEEDGGGINILGILVAVVLALVLMLICSPPRRRAVITVYPKRC